LGGSREDVRITRLAGLSLEELRDQYRQDLFEDFLPFVDRYVVDHELGGFMCGADRDGTRLSTDKRAWFDGRGAWVYSFLYNRISREQRYLDVATRTVDFLLNLKPAGQLWPVRYTREGEPVENLATDIYGDLFIAAGLAEYSKAAGDEAYWQMSREILLKCVEIYDKPGYGARGAEGGMPALSGARILGHWMLLLWLATQLLEERRDREVEIVAARCVAAIMNHHLNPEFGLLNEHIEHDFSRLPNAWAQHVCTGHAMETLWMVMAEGVRCRELKLFELAARYFRQHAEVAWDEVYGGFFHTLKNVEESVWEERKYAWVQEEVLIGTMMLVEHAGAEWAQEVFSRAYRYVRDKLRLKKRGYSLHMRAADRKATFTRHADNIDIFHNPRHLMLNLLSLERLIDRGGKVSGVFAG